jgi:hypothetical protein
VTTGWDDLQLSISREIRNLEVFRINGFLIGERKGGVGHLFIVSSTLLLIFSLEFRKKSFISCLLSLFHLVIGKRVRFLVSFTVLKMQRHYELTSTPELLSLAAYVSKDGLVGKRGPLDRQTLYAPVQGNARAKKMGMGW